MMQLVPILSPTSLSQHGQPSFPIPTLEVSQHLEMLGVFFSPDGDESTHIKKMKYKGIFWFDFLHMKSFPWRDVWLSFHLKLLPEMTLGLPIVIIHPNKME